MRMKRNVFLRLALCFLLAAVTCSSLVIGTTHAKYVAAAVGNATARVATFSFVSTNKTSTAYGSGASFLGRGAPFGTTPQQIAVDAGKVTDFQVPAFCYEYDRPIAAYGGQATNPTVQGRQVSGTNRRFVVAPGTGPIFGPGRAVTGDVDADGFVNLIFRNDSEVAVKFKVTLDYDKCVLRGVPFIISDPYIAEGWKKMPTTGTVVLTDNRMATSVDLFTYCGSKTPGATGTPLAAPTAAQQWIYLEPNGGTYTVKFGMIWFFDNLAPNLAGEPAHNSPLNGAGGFAARADGRWFDNNPQLIYTQQNWGLTKYGSKMVNFDDSTLGYGAQELVDRDPNGSGHQGLPAPTPTNADLKLSFKLEVEQVD